MTTQAQTETWIERSLQRLRNTELLDRVPMQATCSAIGGEPVSFAEAFSRTFEPISIGKPWGVAWDTVWFRFTAAVPYVWTGRGAVVALIELGGPTSESFGWEGMVWKDGCPVRALGSFRNDVPLQTQAIGGEAVDIMVEGAANLNAPRHRLEPVSGVDVGGVPLFDLRRAELALVDPRRAPLLRRWEFLLRLLRAPATPEPVRGSLRAALADTARLAEARGWETIDALQRALTAAEGHVAGGPWAHEVTAVGHCHIDTAWCWPVREAARKCARSFATALAYMAEYPDYVFAASQTLHYAWMRDRYPELWQGIQAAVARGQWEVLAGMWIEPDVLVPCGESLVRQILLGKRWVRDQLGVDVRVLWLPDVFGYSPVLPQLMAQSGFDGFFTQKLSWNQVNRLPHHTFWWEGIDGTRILAHFPPSDTYGGSAMPEEVQRAACRFLDHESSGSSLYAFGHGDGGGGPTREMIEAVRAMASVQSLPRVRPGTVHDFFDRLRAEPGPRPVWQGELYLETHRGTYTTAGRLKRGNREGETRLRQAEFLTAITGVLYPQVPGTATRALLREAWELLLLNQFHDILPGTSIPWVTVEAERDHQRAQALAIAVLDAQLDLLAAELPVAATGDCWAINASDFAFEGVLDTTAGPFWGSVPGWGWAAVGPGAALPEGTVPVEIECGPAGLRIENGLLRACFDAETCLISLWDKRAMREVLPPGARANRLVLHPDYPNDSDAWDIDATYRLIGETLSAPDSMEVLETGPLRATVRVRRRVGKASTLEQDITLRAGSTRLDFATRVNWQEAHRLLRVYFPCAIHSPRATHGIQYGHVERPTHENTSWEQARFESPGQRWVDLSEAGYGVALLDDGKYGRSVLGHEIGLSLLRGPRAPDPVMDLGPQQFTYAIFPHLGGLVEGGVVAEATRLNQPLHFRPWPTGGRGTLPARVSWFGGDTHFLLDWIKPVERGTGLIVRGYEPNGGRGTARASSTLHLAAVQSVNLLEEPSPETTPMEANSDSWFFSTTPFCIRSFHLT
ncbi:MAG: glycoside hydrolase family 38 C-terminal domain-containing protein [Verrucomicrobiota bacterium]|nr:glycoside hydrolase family 38 C-terminal domain-containing protein [Verrucomicrobiota bacterium]